MTFQTCQLFRKKDIEVLEVELGERCFAGVNREEVTGKG